MKFFMQEFFYSQSKVVIYRFPKTSIKLDIQLYKYIYQHGLKLEGSMDYSITETPINRTMANKIPRAQQKILRAAEHRREWNPWHLSEKKGFRQLGQYVCAPSRMDNLAQKSYITYLGIKMGHFVHIEKPNHVIITREQVRQFLVLIW